jgi:hypothetical protein
MSKRHSSVSLWRRVERRGLTITTSHLLLDIQSFWLLSHRFFKKRTSHW